jgi:hypothetical protein
MFDWEKFCTTLYDVEEAHDVTSNIINILSSALSAIRCERHTQHFHDARNSRDAPSMTMDFDAHILPPRRSNSGAFSSTIHSQWLVSLRRMFRSQFVGGLHIHRVRFDFKWSCTSWILMVMTPQGSGDRAERRCLFTGAAFSFCHHTKY